MKRKRYLWICGLFIGITCFLALEGAAARGAFGQSKAKMESGTSDHYVRLTDAGEVKGVRAKVERFYKTQDLPRFTARGVKIGHISRGVITSEEIDHSELELDIDPCNTSMEVFHKPYRKTDLSKTITCKNKLLTYYEVEQE